MKPLRALATTILLYSTAALCQSVEPSVLSSPIASPLALPAGKEAPLPDSPVPQTRAFPLTVEEAVSMAERNSPRIRGALAATDRATAALLRSKAYANPSLEVFEGRQYARPVTVPGPPGLLQHYAGSQAIEIPLERRARSRVAELARGSVSLAQQGIARSVSADARHAFYDVLRRREEVAQAQENLKLVEDLRRRVEVEYKVGEKGRLELTRTEAELARAGFAVRGAQMQLANAIALLRIAIAAPVDEALDPQGSLDVRMQLPDLASLRTEVLRNHPYLAQAMADVDTAHAMLAHERTLRIPQPTVFAEFENQPDLRFWRTGVTIPIPLWDRRRGAINESKAVIAQTQSQADQRRLELISATERAYEQYQLADQQVTSLESGDLHAALSAVDAAKAAYRFGERGIVEVLDAQRVLQAVRGDLIDAQFARQSAHIDLEELGAIAPGGKP